MAKQCSSCGNTNCAPQAKFCTQCGNSLTTTTTTTSTASTSATSSPSFKSIASSGTGTGASNPKSTFTSVVSTSGLGSPSAKSTLKTAPVISTTTTTSTAAGKLPAKNKQLSQSTGSLKPLPPPPTSTTSTASSTPPPLPSKPRKSTSTTSTLVKPLPSVAPTPAPASTATGNSVNVTRIRATAPAPKPEGQRSTSSSSLTSTPSQPTENFMNIKLKSTKVNNGEPINIPNRPKSHTVSLVSIDEKASVPVGSFVKLSVKSRDQMDNIAHKDVLVLNGELPIATNGKDKDHKEHKEHKEKDRKKESSNGNGLPELPPKKKRSSSVSSPGKEKERESVPLPPVDKEKEAEKERQREEREKQRLAEKADRDEKERQRQLDRERIKKEEKERLKKEEKEEKDEKEKQRMLEREKRAEEKRQRNLEREKRRTLKVEKDREKRESTSSPVTVLSGDEEDSDNGDTEVAAIDSPSTPSAGRTDSGVSSPKMSFTEMSEVAKNKELERRKKEREKYNTSPARSRFFSFILGNGMEKPEKEAGSDDDVVISAPSSPAPLSPSTGLDDNASNDGDSEDGQPQQLRKWAIKRNELNGSKGDLMASLSPTLTSANSSGHSSLQLAAHHRYSVGSDSGSGSAPISASPTSHSFLHTKDSPSNSSSSIGTSPSASSQSLTSPAAAAAPAASGPQAPPNLPEMPQATDQRSRVIEEIIVTERDYIRDLEIMVWMRKEMIGQEDAKGSQLDEINAMFSNVEQLLMVNQELYKKYIELPLPTDPKNTDFGASIANAFISLSQFLKSYFVYCSNQQKAFQTFSGLRGKNCSFLGYLLTRRECRSLPFDSFLIKPVQRICKYPLLLRELIKSTATTMSSYALLQEAQKKIEGIVSTVNEKKREFDGQMRMYDIQTRITEGGSDTKILSPSRKLIKEGELSSWGFIIPGNTSTTYNKKPKQGNYYLFNDLLVFAQPVTSALQTNTGDQAPLKVKGNIPLDACLVREHSGGEPNSFELLYSCHQVWWFQTETPEELETMLAEFKQVIESNHMVEYKKYVEDRERQSKSHVDFEEWRKAVKNKPLPEPPSPKPPKNLPSIPATPADCVSIKVNCHHLDPRHIEISKELPTLKTLKEKIQLKFSLDNLDFTVQSQNGATFQTISNDQDLQNIVKTDPQQELEMKIIALKL